MLNDVKCWFEIYIHLLIEFYTLATEDFSEVLVVFKKADVFVFVSLVNSLKCITHFLLDYVANVKGELGSNGTF